MNSQFFFKILEELSEVDMKTPWGKTSFFDAFIKAKTGYVTLRSFSQLKTLKIGDESESRSSTDDQSSE